MNENISIEIVPVQQPQQINIEVSPVYAAGVINQNNFNKIYSYFKAASRDQIPSQAEVAVLMNMSRPVVITETQVPFVSVSILGSSPLIRHLYFFKGGKGTWGGVVYGGTTVSGDDLYYLNSQNVTAQDVEDGGNTSVFPLGVLQNADYIAAANAQRRNLNNADLYYFIKFTYQGIDYLLRFIGTTYGIYGGNSSLQFTEDMFEDLPVASAPAPAVPTLKQITDSTGLGYTNNPITVEKLNDGNAIAKAIYDASGISFRPEGGYRVFLSYASPVNDVIYTVPAKSGDDIFIMKSDVDLFANQLLDGAAVEYNTLGKIQQKILALNSIIGQAGPDANNLVDTVAELLQVFQNYPEGANISQVLAGKINSTDIINNLNQGVSGKVLDAAQGKILNDAIVALTTVVNSKLTGTQASDLETQITASVSEDNKYVTRLKLYNWSKSSVFADLVRGTVLTGISFGSTGVVVATDTVVSAFGKLQAQISNKAVAADYTNSTADVSKVPTIKSILDFKNLTSFWKSSAFSGSTSRMVQANADGSFTAGTEILTTDRKISDNDIISVAVSATYNASNNFTAIIIPLNSKIFYEGQYFFSGVYKYEAETNNTVRRIILG